MSGFDCPPEIAGKYSGRIVVCGSGACLWRDLEALGEWSGHWMAVNLSGAFLPFDPQHWASLHPELFQWVVPLRGWQYHGDRMSLTCKAHTHSNRPGPSVRHVWSGACSGDSALFATKVALELGYEEVVLAGVPLDGSGHFYDQPRAQIYPADEWERAAFGGRVTSMSGLTREMFGSPQCSPGGALTPG